MEMNFNPVKIAAAVSTQFKYHGWRMPFVAMDRLCTYWYRRTFGPRSFKFRGKDYRYFHHPYVLHVERVVEIAIVADFWQSAKNAAKPMEGHGKNVLEVGNVLWHYFPETHDVVDKYEKAPGVMNVDIVDYHPDKQYDLIFSISTLEHVGWDEEPKDKEKIPRAIANLKQLLNESGQLVVTVPIGYNPHLDELLKTGKTGFSEVYFLKRISKDNQWREALRDEVMGLPFGKPYPCANGLAVMYYDKR